jgi:hypothetical protein
MATFLNDSTPLCAIHQGPLAVARTQQLHHDASLLIEAVQVGVTAKQSTSPSQNNGAGGSRLFHDTVGALRDMSEPLGWTRFDHLNLGGIEHVEAGLVILVVGGQLGVGDPTSIRPQPKYPRKTATFNLVNFRQPSLWEPERAPQADVWFLMHHVREREFAMELAKPRSITKKGAVEEYDERIIFDIPDGGGSRRRTSDVTADVPPAATVSEPLVTDRRAS